MFDSLQNKLSSAFQKIRGKASISQADLEETMRTIRIALLEADVNFQIAKDFCEQVIKQALGREILKSLTPDQQIIKIVNEELTKMMGGFNSELNLKVKPPAIIMLAGLQGAGKTTTAAKLAKLLKDKLGRDPLLVPADVYRPAAIEQLKILANQIQVNVFDTKPNSDPVIVAKESLDLATRLGNDTIIIDTAGRLQIDTELMAELKEIVATVNPHEILLVADAMTGQEAVNVAKGFHAALNITGLILTKLDGDARGGAALSMRAVTGCPIKFIGISEKPDGLEVFYPDRMASRILDLGDVLSLIEKATEKINLEESLKLQKKLKKNKFELDDFLSQLKTMQNMGSMSSILGMIPGLGKLKNQVNSEDMEKELKKVEAIILSMTKQERSNSAIINGKRRARIAKGSGTKVEDVNRLLKQFLEMKKMMAKLSKGGMGQMMKMLGNISQSKLI